MINLNEIIIVGGGTSILEGLNQGLQSLIENKCVILTNYAFKHFYGTFLVFTDRDFYKPRPEANNPDIYDELKKLPLIIGLNINGIEEFKLDNTILLDKKYREVLAGIFALKLAEQFNPKQIFLLGFDWNRRIGLPERDPNYSPNSNLQIHYYKDIAHRGIGYVGYYENHNPDKVFAKFIKKDVKIYNVSPKSNIHCFEKITYTQMFKILNKEIYNQEELRLKIKNFLIRY